MAKIEGHDIPKPVEAIRSFCLALPEATENIQWGADLVFKIGGKMFAVTNVHPEGPYTLSFKCTPDTFGALIEKDGIKPAPYMARHCWVLLEQLNALSEEELHKRLRGSYELVVETLPKKKRPGAQAVAAAPKKKPARSK
jgi:predicted DNA-binding protein (MmcQ/YjbR family)